LTPPTVAGIDVGGDRKGNHLVILRGAELVCNLGGATPERMLEQCRAFEVTAVGIDAPCRWRTGAAARLAEKALAQQRIFSFATPARELALASQSGFYGWMFNGERVYDAFAAHFPLFSGGATVTGRVCFETFPHAITCAFLGTDVASAKRKGPQRRQILEREGIASAPLGSIDDVDAALCAVAARYLLAGRINSFGDESGGFIVVPRL
jgi:predicted nuclease with RNAse H fold